MLGCDRRLLHGLSSSDLDAMLGIFAEACCATGNSELGLDLLSSWTGVVPAEVVYRETADIEEPPLPGLSGLTF